MATDETFANKAYPIRIILPIVYTFIVFIGFIGNLLNFYSLCISRDRFGRKSLHVLIWNLILESSIWSSIFYIVKMVSYADLGEHFALNNGQWLNNSWCKAEMYILRVMDFILAYTIVFLCLDRCVKRKRFCYGQRRFVTGICLLISIWLSITYALIPILFFNQQLKSLDYGSYECVYNETQINQLTWLDSQNVQTPTRTVYLLDFIFGNALPGVLMIVFLVLRYFIHRKREIKTYQDDSKFYDDENPNLIKMVNNLSLLSFQITVRFVIQVFAYVIVYLLCQYPYYTYRLVRIYHPSVDSHNLLYAIDIPLIILRLINRSINPWLSFGFIRAIRDGSRQICSTFWCCGCFPCCPNRWSCLHDCSACLHYEWEDLTANHQTIREIRPTGKIMRTEFLNATGQHVRQTYEEFIRFYHRPRTQFSDANPALLVAERTAPNGNQNWTFLQTNQQKEQIRTEL